MSGLVLKELYVVKKTARAYLLILLVYAVLTAVGTFDTSFLSGFLALFVMMMPMTSFSYDDLARWDKYAAALPVGRRGIVRSKYIFTLLLVVAALVLGLGLSAAACALKLGGNSWTELVIVNFACVAVGLLLNAVIMPFMFKYGAEKSRVIMLAVFVVVFGGGLLLVQFGGESLAGASAFFASPAGVAAAVMLVVLFLAASYFISCGIYQKKEF